MKIKNLFVTAVLSLGLISAASAASFTYSFTASGGNVTSVGPVSGGSGSPTVTVTPYSHTGSALYDSSTYNSATHGVRITQNGSYGMGVQNSNLQNSSDGSHTVDNSGWKDMLLFTFSSSVTFNSVTFGWVGNDSDFRYWIGGNGSTAASLYGSGGTNVSGGSSPGTFNSGSTAPFGGTGWTLLIAARPDHDNDDFKISGLSVTTANNTPDTGSTVALLGLALAGLASLKRRFTA